MKKWAVLMGFMPILAGCETNIHARDETQVPPSVPFGQYSNIYVSPLSNGSPDQFPERAAKRVETDLRKCIDPIFKTTQSFDQNKKDYANKSLLIKPAILDAKKVSTAQRILFGWMSGSSAALLQVSYIDLKTNVVIAQPIFYAKTSAGAGAVSYGGADNEMLNQLARNACDYARDYKSAEASPDATTGMAMIGGAGLALN